MAIPNRKPTFGSRLAQMEGTVERFRKQNAFGGAGRSLSSAGGAALERGFLYGSIATDYPPGVNLTGDPALTAPDAFAVARVGPVQTGLFSRKFRAYYYYEGVDSDLGHPWFYRGVADLGALATPPPGWVLDPPGFGFPWGAWFDPIRLPYEVVAIGDPDALSNGYYCVTFTLPTPASRGIDTSLFTPAQAAFNLNMGFLYIHRDPIAAAASPSAVNLVTLEAVVSVPPNE